jgi:hypothetical protein
MEAAIPLNELTANAALDDAVWACNVKRVVPAKGTLAVSQPAGFRPRPEGFTHLRFAKQRVDDASAVQKAN